MEVLEGDADLADVVEQAGALQVAPVGAREAHGPPELLGVVGHALRVAAGVVVLGLEGVGQAHQHVLRGLELVHEAPSAGAGSGAGQELLEVHGLGQEVVAPGGDALDAVLPCGEGGDEDDGHEAGALVGLEARQASRPESRGIDTSIKMRSGGRASAISTACAPSWASSRT